MRLTVHFVITRYKGVETNPYACLTGTRALNLEEGYCMHRRLAGLHICSRYYGEERSITLS
jgi:hypothetical protein